MKRHNKLFFILFFVLAFSWTPTIFAANPGAPISPGDNIQDPGSLSTPWGGCGPTDSNCYVTVSGGDSIYSADGTIVGDRTINLDGNFLKVVNGSNNFFTINTNTGLYTLGDLNGSNNTSYLKIDDQNKLAILRTGFHTSLALDESGGNSIFTVDAYHQQLGDINGFQNGTLFQIDDATQQFSFINGHVAIGSPDPQDSIFTVKGPGVTYLRLDPDHTIFSVFNSADEDNTAAIEAVGTNLNLYAVDDGDISQLQINALNQEFIFSGGNISFPNTAGGDRSITTSGSVTGTGTTLRLVAGSGSSGFGPGSGGDVYVTAGGGGGVFGNGGSVYIDAGHGGDFDGRIILGSNYGNVGIGTSFPTSTLDIASGGHTFFTFKPFLGTGYITTAGGVYDDEYGLQADGANFLVSWYPGGNEIIFGNRDSTYWSINPNTNLSTFHTQQYVFQGEGGDEFKIDGVDHEYLFDPDRAGGKLGIGTNDPLGPIDVIGVDSSNYVRLENSTTYSNFSVRTHDNGGDNFGTTLISSNAEEGILIKASNGLGTQYSSITMGTTGSQISLGVQNGSLLAISTVGSSFLGSNVGIGDITPDYLLDIEKTSVDGNIFALHDSDGECLYNPEAGSVTVSCSSDQRLKSNIIDSGSVLEYLDAFHIREYDVIASGNHMTGVIAQEVLQTNPELVTQGIDGMYSVQLPNQWKIVKAIQELDFKIEEITDFVNTDTNSFVGKLRNWLANSNNGITTIFATLFEGNTVKGRDKVCVGDTCIDEAQLKALLQQNQVATPPSDPITPPPETPTDDPVPTEPIPSDNPTP